MASASRPRPLYVSTASQIGLLDTAGIPSLVDAVLGVSAEAEVRRLMQRLLLHPPVPTLPLPLPLCSTVPLPDPLCYSLRPTAVLCLPALSQLAARDFYGARR
jgi:hypothetical protein